MSKRWGFTLIELLLVIGIISLLMAILMPALRKAHQQAHAAVCRSNLRQIGLAANMYAEYWDWYVPRGTSIANATWYQLFMPYLGERVSDTDYRKVKIYRCPSYPDKEQTVCYVLNAWDMEDPNDIGPDETQEPTSIFSLRKPMEVIYLADNEDGPWRYTITHLGDMGWHMCDVWSLNHLPTNTEPNPNHSTGRRVARARHNKGKQHPGSHYLFLDWHVEWIESDLVTPEMWWFR